MMTLGRLRAIESYWARIKPENFGHPVVSTACKHTAELFDEVKRLRESLEVLKIRCGDHIALGAKNDSPQLSLLLYVHDFCCEALREPDLPLDIVLVRPHPYNTGTTF